MRGGQVTVRAGTLDLGRNLPAPGASFVLEATQDGISIRNLDAVLGTGKLTGAATITRQGALASIVGEGALRDVPLSALTVAPFDARLSGALKFGTSGETLASLVANLGGSGDWTVANLKVPDADPAALDRAGKQLLRGSEPLVAGRAESVIGAELNRGPLRLRASPPPLPLLEVACDFRRSWLKRPSIWRGPSHSTSNRCLSMRGDL